MNLYALLANTVAAARQVRLDSKAARRVTSCIKRERELDPALLHRFLSYTPDSILLTVAEKAATVTTWAGAATALIFGSLFAAYPEIPSAIRAGLASFELGQRMHGMFNYWHSVHDSRVEVAHLAYHIPDLGFDLALFSPLYLLAARVFLNFGWRRHLPRFKKAAQDLVEKGQHEPAASLRLRWKMQPCFTGIIVGDGDPLGDEIVRTRSAGQVLLLATTRQPVTDVWVHLNSDASLEDLARAFQTANFGNCGVLVVLPVQAQHMVFPPDTAYDIAPDKLDDLVRNIKTFEQRMVQQHNPEHRPIPIIIVGDKRQSTVIHTYEPETHVPVAGQSATINLGSIGGKYGSDLIIIDPTELVLKRVMCMAEGAAIVFRGTEESRRLYESQFIERLKELNYRVIRPGNVFRMGYNITDDPTVADPGNSAAVILTASARDALIDKGFPRDRILFVPEMVIEEIQVRTGRINN